MNAIWRRVLNVLSGKAPASAKREQRLAMDAMINDTDLVMGAIRVSLANLMAKSILDAKNATAIQARIIELTRLAQQALSDGREDLALLWASEIAALELSAAHESRRSTEHAQGITRLQVALNTAETSVQALKHQVATLRAQRVLPEQVSVSATARAVEHLRQRQLEVQALHDAREEVHALLGDEALEQRLRDANVIVDPGIHPQPSGGSRQPVALVPTVLPLD